MKSLFTLIFVITCCGTLQARSLEQIRAELEALEAQEDAEPAADSPCARGLTLLGVTAATGGGIFALRQDHPEVVAMRSAQQELGPYEGNYHRASEEVRDAEREVSKIGAAVSRLETGAEEARASAAKYRGSASSASSEGSRRHYERLAEEADSRASDLEAQARAEADKLRAANERHGKAAVAQSEADAAARPLRQRVQEHEKRGLKIAEQCK